MMTIKYNFTKHFLANISPPPDNKRSYYYDSRVNGLLIQVTNNGVKSYQVYKWIKNKPVRVTLGKFPDLPVEKARKMAIQKLAEMAQGINPNAKKKEEAKINVTLNEVLIEYFKVRKELSKNTVDGYKGSINKYFSDWLEKPLKSINRGQVAKRHLDISEDSPSAANKAMRILRALFNFAQGQYEDAEERSLFPDNPVQKLSHTKAWNRENRRTGIIERSQLVCWYKAVNNLCDTDDEFNAVVRDYLLFILFTGLRRREASMLEWKNVNFDDEYFTIVKTKNKNILKLPMSEFTCKLLKIRWKNADSDYVFGGGNTNAYLNDPRRQIAKVRNESGLNFTIHDLRRTYITIAESLELSAYVLKMLINHSMGNDVTAGYVIMDVERLRKPYSKISKILYEECAKK